MIMIVEKYFLCSFLICFCLPLLFLIWKFPWELPDDSVLVLLTKNQKRFYGSSCELYFLVPMLPFPFSMLKQSEKNRIKF